MGTVQRMQVSSAFDNSHWVNSRQGNPGEKGAKIEVKVKCNPEGRETEACLGQCFSNLTVCKLLGELVKMHMAMHPVGQGWRPKSGLLTSSQVISMLLVPRAQWPKAWRTNVKCSRKGLEAEVQSPDVVRGSQ